MLSLLDQRCRHGCNFLGSDVPAKATGSRSALLAEVILPILVNFSDQLANRESQPPKSMTDVTSHYRLELAQLLALADPGRTWRYRWKSVNLVGHSRCRTGALA